MQDSLLITGASGQLGAYLLGQMVQTSCRTIGWMGASGTSQREPAPGGCNALGQTLLPVDLTKPDDVAALFRSARPRRVVHLAAVSRVGTCYDHPQRAQQVNVEATRQLVELAEEGRAHFVLASTDMVFDGRRGAYAELDVPAPLSVYGRSKLAAEQYVRDYEHGLVVRLSLLYGPSRNGRPNFFDAQCEALRQARPVPLFVDEWRTPLSLPVAATGLKTLAWSDYRGLLHMGGPETLSRWQLGRELAHVLGVDESLVVADRAARHAFDEPRPRDVSLDSRRLHRMFPHLPRPACEEALRQLIGGR